MVFGLVTVITFVFGGVNLENGTTDQQIWTAERLPCLPTWSLSISDSRGKFYLGYDSSGQNVRFYESETTNTIYFSILLQPDESVLLRVADKSRSFLLVDNLTNAPTLLNSSLPTQSMTWQIILKESFKGKSKRSIYNSPKYGVEVYMLFGSKKWTFGYAEPDSPISVQQTGKLHIWELNFDGIGWSFSTQNLYASWMGDSTGYVLLDTHPSAAVTRHYTPYGYGGTRLKANGHPYDDYLSISRYQNLILQGGRYAVLWDIVVMGIIY